MRRMLLVSCLFASVIIGTGCAVNSVHSQDSVGEMKSIRDFQGKAESRELERIFPDMMELSLFREGAELWCNIDYLSECLNEEIPQCVSTTRTYVYGCIVESKTELGTIEGVDGGKKLSVNFLSCLYDHRAVDFGKEKFEECLSEKIKLNETESAESSE